MLGFVPLHKSAVERQPRVLTMLLRQVVNDTDEIKILNTTDWFTVPQEQDGIFVWVPPPCLADVAVFLMAEAWHVRPWNTHVILTPSLLSGRWRRMLSKAVDMFCVLPFSEEFWPKDTEHEPLTIAFAFPLLNRNPWRVKFSDILKYERDVLRQMHRKSIAHARDYLRQFWIRSGALEAMPGGVSSSLLCGARNNGPLS